ncbi:unnamed protein product [Paramecium primaurelia]|uniref:Uncharacterized protein n=1 Tax=Paramecium primaurelia TaxID=5886 RepID=A0A8S1PLU0_PARPR|nr:unnamed protein product [Paramecium primaurelia]
MQGIAKIPVEMSKTLDDNYKMIKDQCIYEMCLMINNLLDQKQAPHIHIRLQFLYNIHKWEKNMCLSDLCINQLEMNIIDNIKYYGQSLEQILRQTHLLQMNKIEPSYEFMRPIPTIYHHQSFDYIQLDLIHPNIWDYNISPLIKFRHLLCQAQCQVKLE